MDQSTQETLWLTCAAKRCCTLRTVVVTGADIARIATTLDVPPESFLRMVPAASGEEGFALDGSAQRFHMALARRSGKSTTTGCLFLIHVDDTVARCGLGSLRPRACQAFPATGSEHVVNISTDALCSCRTWTIANLDRGRARALLGRWNHEQERYHQLVRDWNAQVQAQGKGRFTFSDFCRYVLDAYKQGEVDTELWGTE